MRPGIAAAALIASASLTASASQQSEPRTLPAAEPPVFRSAVDLVAVDVQVVNRDGLPIDTLGIDDFQVSFNGRTRRVVSVDFVRKLAVPPADAGGPERPVYTPGVVSPGTRVFVIAIDSNSLAARAIKPLARAAQEFLKQLDPDDLVGLYVYPFDRPLINLTHDHFAVGRAIDRVIGTYQPYGGSFDLSVSEALDIAANDSDTFRSVRQRECIGRGDLDPVACARAVEMEAVSQASYYESQGVAQLRGVNLLLESLRMIDGRKTVVLLSGGMPSADRVGGRPVLAESMTTIGAEASAANANVYVVHVDNSYFEASSAANHASEDPSSAVRSQMRDAYLLGIGLDRLAGASGGALLRDSLGTGSRAFDRVLRETSGYYLLGVQPLGDDRDGKLHFLRVNVKKRGLIIRSRTQVAIPKTKAG